MKLPSIQFYPGDWLRDPVSGCSLAAQGLWLRMMMLMHDSDRYGHLSHKGVPVSDATIARRCGCSLEEYTTLFAELTAAGVPSKTPAGVIHSRRMVRDAKKRSDGAARLAKFRCKSRNSKANGNADVTHDKRVSGGGDETRVKHPASSSVSSSTSTSVNKTPLPPSDEGEVVCVAKKKGPLQLRAEKLMRRRPETPLAANEQRALQKNKAAIQATTEDEWLALEQFYAAPQRDTFARKDLAALLNNWNGEIDRAKAWVLNPRKRQEVPLTEQLKALEALIAEHPCNPESRSNTGNETDAQRDEYRKLKADRDAVKRLIAAGGQQ